MKNLGLLDSAKANKTCTYCNLLNCKCLFTVKKSKFYGSIVEQYLKKKKWVTRIKVELEKEEFSALKEKLGTGGTYSKFQISLRGKVEKRSKILLSQMGYKESTNKFQI
jgi:translation initiation factor 1 (eIF-1/SUI1)